MNILGRLIYVFKAWVNVQKIRTRVETFYFKNTCVKRVLFSLPLPKSVSFTWKWGELGYRVYQPYSTGTVSNNDSLCVSVSILSHLLPPSLLRCGGLPRDTPSDRVALLQFGSLGNLGGFFIRLKFKRLIIVYHGQEIVVFLET